MPFAGLEISNNVDKNPKSIVFSNKSSSTVI